MVSGSQSQIVMVSTIAKTTIARNRTSRSGGQLPRDQLCMNISSIVQVHASERLKSVLTEMRVKPIKRKGENRPPVPSSRTTAEAAAHAFEKTKGASFADCRFTWWAIMLIHIGRRCSTDRTGYSGSSRIPKPSSMTCISSAGYGSRRSKASSAVPVSHVSYSVGARITGIRV